MHHQNNLGVLRTDEEEMKRQARLELSDYVSLVREVKQLRSAEGGAIPTTLLT